MRKIAELERNRDRYGSGWADRKLEWLHRLERAELASAKQVRRLHEVLCFLQAYPDDARILDQVDRMLRAFASRRDLQEHRDELAYSGIAGTVIWFPFFYPTARWIAARWPDALTHDRTDRVAERSIAKLLPALVTPIEAHALREAHLAGYAALDRLRGSRTDATFLIDRIAAMPGNERTREAFYDEINPSCELAPVPGTPSRTQARFDRASRAWHSTALARERPDLRAELRQAPRSIRRASRTDVADLLRLAREAMITRQRDLDAFAYGNERDVWLVDHTGGLSFALIGMVPERRAALPAIYGGLTLQNGVPIGYHQSDLLGHVAAVSFNTFDSFRGGESAHVFVRLLASLRFVFGVDSFSIEPFQLGDDNAEGLASGAWWFYSKFGFRPRDERLARIAAREFEHVRRNPKYRTPISVLKRLATRHVFFDADPARPAPLITPADIGLQVGAFLGQLAPDDRARAIEIARQRALKICGLRNLNGWTASQRYAWELLSALIAMFDVRDWTHEERRALADWVRAKGAPSERAYARLFARHTRLQAVLAAIARRSD